MTTRTTIVTVSSNRADLGIVGPVWRALAERDDIDHHVLLTGSWAEAADLALATIPQPAQVHVAGAALSGGEDAAIASAMHRIGLEAGEVLARVRPDLLLVAGDRLDMFPVVTASLPFNIPVAHIAGGDLSYGAIDDRLRHAITKLSHLHFVLNDQSAARVRAMGEERWRIVIAGAPNLDTLIAMPHLPAAAFAAELGLDSLDRLRLVTVHPETNSADPIAPLRALLPVLAEDPAPVLITAPNPDPGGQDMAGMVEDFVRARPSVVYRDTLGARLYANALRHAAMMVGNSSSGIIEAGLFGLPVVNIGTRQLGRDAGPNVIPCEAHVDDVRRAVARAEAMGRLDTASSLYGDGRAAQRIAAVLTHLPDRQTLLNKRFAFDPCDFEVPWANDGQAGQTATRGLS